MADRTCSLCGKEFDFPSGLSRHQKRKTNCAVSGARLQCIHCGASFTRPGNLQRHLRDSCAKSGELRQHLDGAGVTYNQHTTNIGQITINAVTIAPFGEEKIEYITRELMADIFNRHLAQNDDQGRKAANGAFIETATRIYSNMEHTANITCYMPSARSKEVFMSDGKTWIPAPITDVAPKMTNATINAMVDKQPFDPPDRIEQYSNLLRATFENEDSYKKGAELRAVLAENKRKLERLATPALPGPGQPA